MNKCWNLIIAGIISFPGLSWAQTDSLLVKGVLKQDSEDLVQKVWFSFTNHKGEDYKTSADVRSGTFRFSVPKQELVVDGMLRFTGSDPMNGAMYRPLTLFIRKDDITISGHANEPELAFVAGGKENDDYNDLRQSTADIARKVSSIHSSRLKETVQNEEQDSKDLMKSATLLLRQEYDKQREFIKKNPDSYVSLFLLYRLKNMYVSDSYAATFESLNSQYRETKMGKTIQSNIDREAITAQGQVAQPFERTTAIGKPFKLEELKGKTFLLDFWGSWCGPCRASMPHLLDLYEKYKKDGFEVLGVAQERGRTIDEANISWKKAIDELGIHWINVLNNELKAEFDIVKAYGVISFPTKILVDKEGKIIMRISASATDDVDVALKKIYGY